VLVAVGVAAVLRTTLYAHRLSFWNDEAAIVINLVDRDAAGLMRPLDYAQVAPPGFLLLHKWLVGSRPPDEYALRAPELAAALAATVLFAIVAHRLLGRSPGAVFAVSLFAFGGRIIRNSIEVKQYGWDVLAGVALMPFVVGAGGSPGDGGGDDGRGGRGRPLLLGCVGAVSFWFSFPAIFVFAAVWVVSAVRAARVSAHLALWHVAGLVPAAVSLGVLACVTFGARQDAYLYQYWADAFVNWRHPATWLVAQTYSVFDYNCRDAGLLLLAVVVCGGVWLYRHGRADVALTVLAILALNVAAAAVRRYPYDGSRVTLYVVPWLFLLAGASCRREAWPHWLGAVWKAVPIAVLGFVAVPPVYQAFAPPEQSTMRPVAQYVRARHVAGQPIFLIADGEPSRQRVTGRNLEFLCYWRTPPAPVRFDFPDPDQIRDDAFWLVYSAPTAKNGPLESRLNTLEARFAPVLRVTTPLAGAVLFRKRPSEPAGGDPPGRAAASELSSRGAMSGVLRRLN
jgi:hypothetical protein